MKNRTGFKLLYMLLLINSPPDGKNKWGRYTLSLLFYRYFSVFSHCEMVVWKFWIGNKLMFGEAGKIYIERASPTKINPAHIQVCISCIYIMAGVDIYIVQPKAIRINFLIKKAFDHSKINQPFKIYQEICVQSFGNEL